MKRTPYRPKTKAKAPSTAADAAPLVHKFMVKLFDRDDGEAAPWSMIAATLFKVAFDALDRLPLDNEQTVTLLRRVHGSSYDRLVKNAAGPFEVSGSSAPSPTRLPGRSPQAPSA